MRNASLDRMQKYHSILAALFFAAAIVALCLLLSEMTVYSDDYHFGTFFRDGPGAFFEETVNHYCYSNGRLLVHFLLELTLLADTKVYLFLCPLLICLTIWLLPGVLGVRLTFAELCSAMGATIFLVIGLSTQMLRESLLWMSGSFNFVLPMGIVFAAAYFQKKYLTMGKVGFAGILFALLAGATTEQYGFFTCIVLWGMAIMHSVRAKKQIGKNFLLPLCALIGYLTVLLSPGIWLRIGNESGGLLTILNPAVLVKRFSEIMTFVTNGCLPVLVFFCLAAASLVFAGKQYSKLLLLGYPIGLILYFGAQVNVALSELCFLLYLLFTAILLVCKREHTEMGCLLLGAFGSQLILLFSGVYGFRTTFPLAFMLILATVYFAVEVLRRCHWLWYLPVFAGVITVSMHWYLPTFQGYRSARAVIDENLAAVKKGESGGTIHLNLDVDESYGYTSFYHNSYFYGSFLKYYRIDPDTTAVFVESSYYPKVFVNGKNAFLPALIEDDGSVFFPIANVLELAGGSYEVGIDTTHISGQGSDYWLFFDGSAFSLYRDVATTDLVVGPQEVKESLCGKVYLRLEFFQPLFGINVTYDEEKNCYELSTVMPQ